MEIGILVPVPKISVVLPHFNDADGLVRALASLDAQTMRDFEVVLVDDGSRPVARARVATIVAASSLDIRSYYFTTNRGAAAARNAALAMARADIVCLLDSDDLFLSEKLEWVVAAFSDPMNRLVVHGYRDWAGDDVDPCRSFSSIASWPWWLIALKNPSVTPAVAFRRDPNLRFDERFRRFDDQLFLVTYARRHGPARLFNYVGTVVPKPLMGVSGLSGRFAPMLRSEVQFVAALSRFGVAGVVVAGVLALVLPARIVRRLVLMWQSGRRYRNRTA